jgi:hypothetical protein
MSLNRLKQYVLKNGEFTGSIVANQSGYSGGMPARINSAGEVARAYDDTGYVGIFANGSDVDVSGAAVTFYTGSGLFTLEKGTGESAYPYLSTETYVIGQAIGITNGLWDNSYSGTTRARVLGVGSVAGSITTSLTLIFVA